MCHEKRAAHTLPPITTPYHNNPDSSMLTSEPYPKLFTQIMMVLLKLKKKLYCILLVQPQ